MLTLAEEIEFREAAFAWLRARQLHHQPYFTRDDLAEVEILGRTFRLLGPQTGIWKVKGLSDAAIGISTSYSPNPKRKPYEDEVGSDGLFRYKWRGTDPHHADNAALRRAMERGLPLVHYVGVDFVPGTKTQLFEAIFPVYLIAEEPTKQQFVVAFEQGQHLLKGDNSDDLQRHYNIQSVKKRLHQPVFRSRVLLAYEEKCAVCRLPFPELLEAAHIRPDAEGGSTRVSNGMSLCKIHHGAYDSEILGISPDYVVHIRESVLETFDGPTLQHALKEMDKEELRQLPSEKSERPDRGLLEERFEKFKKAS